MSDTTMEKKLRLVQQVRSRYNEDQYDMSNRERILYGRSFRRELPEEGNPGEASGQNEVSSFRLRLILAVLLAVAVIFMDKNNINIAGITSDGIFQAISADVEDDIEAWAAVISEKISEDGAPD